MKKILTLVALILGAFVSMAKPVDVNDAIQVALNFYAANTQQTSNEYHVLQGTGFEQMYIINIEGNTHSFVIVSADDRAYPILAYSFDCIPGELGPETRFWLSQYENEIAAVSRGEVDIDAADAALISNLWEQLRKNAYTPSKSGSSVPQLMSTTWNQSPYYNDLCPDGTPVGCTATATAQVMKYWNHPVRGTGSHTYYSYRYGTQSASFDTTYLWDIMPNNVTSSTPADQRAAVALLSYHVGVAIDMDYGPDGSGASVIGTYGASSEQALQTYFGYKSSLHGEQRSSYSDATWVRMLKDDLDAGRPVIYAGYDASAGHCFVFDGYNTSSQFHVNWGWGGSYDGYYSLGALNPGGGGTGTNSSNTFNSWNQAIFGLEPVSRLHAEPEFLNFASNAESLQFTLYTDGNTSSSWHASTNAGWLSVTPTTGAGAGASATVTVTATPNTSGIDRSATITVNHGTKSIQIPIVQLTCEREDMCHLVVKMSGQSSGGWGGAKLNIASSNGTLYGGATLKTGNYDTKTFDVCSDTVVVTYVGSGSNTYNVFSIENTNEAVLATRSREDDIVNGQTWIITNPCSAQNECEPITYAIEGRSTDTIKGAVVGNTGQLRMGELCELAARANTGYRFVKWNDNSTANPRSFYVTAGRTITASFANLGTDTIHYDNGKLQDVYTATDSISWGIRLQASDLVKHRELTGVCFYPTTTGTYKILVYEGGEDAPDSLVYQGSRSVTNSMVGKWSNFTFRTNVQLNHMKNLWVVINGSSAVEASYANWAGNDDGSWISVDRGATWSSLHQLDETIHGTFLVRAAMDYDDNLYTLTASFNRPWGTVTGGGQYHVGEVATLVATPKEGYHLERWNDGVTANPRQLVVVSDTLVRAIFAEGEPQGIDVVAGNDVTIFAQGRTLTVQGAQGAVVSIYDIMGRLVFKGKDVASVTLPAAGVYMVRVADRPSRKVVVY